MPKTLWVGANETYKSLNAAIAASGTGDTIYVRAGTYYDTSASIDHDLNIIGVGGMAKLVTTKPIANEKAMLISHGNVTLKNLDMSGAQVYDNNGAAVRLSDGNLRLENVYIHDNQDGILTLDNSSATLTVVHSEFARNGYGDGYTHGIYANHIQSVVIQDSYFHDTKLGHHVKSRAANTTITGSVFDDGVNGTSSYAVDLPNGGNAKLENNWFHQSATSDNPLVVHFGGEGGYYATNTLRVDNDVLVNDLKGGVFVGNAISGSTVEVDHNQVSSSALVLNGSGGGNAHDNTTSVTSSAKPAWSLWSVGSDGSTSGGSPVITPPDQGQTASTTPTPPPPTDPTPTNPPPTDPTPTNPLPTQPTQPSGTVSTDFNKAVVISVTTSNQTFWNDSGNDSFRFTKLSANHDTIVHFSATEDHLDLRQLQLGQNALTDGHVTFQASGVDTLVFVDPDASGPAHAVQLVKIQGITPDKLFHADWHF